MISDVIDNYHLYPFGAAWEKSFEFIRGLSTEAETGKQLIQGDQLYAGTDIYTTKSRKVAKLEAHRKYIDIQILLSGEEVIDVFPRRGLMVSEPYNPARDAEFYQVPPENPTSMRLIPGHFLAFFPDDAHMPGLVAGLTPQVVKKVVVKVAVELLDHS